ncbi:hypothetical protein B0H10DRAFT_1979600 [Mycena sp. CBHHK59/15]|nr:hypothetical protein B0H10DRAFT_1979600 [Mycena sp. CBHHK59/15]
MRFCHVLLFIKELFIGWCWIVPQLRGLLQILCQVLESVLPVSPCMHSMQMGWFQEYERLATSRRDISKLDLILF